jgi:hypothetical protein
MWRKSGRISYCHWIVLVAYINQLKWIGASFLVKPSWEISFTKLLMMSFSRMVCRACWCKIEWCGNACMWFGNSFDGLQSSWWTEIAILTAYSWWSLNISMQHEQSSSDPQNHWYLVKLSVMLIMSLSLIYFFESEQEGVSLLPFIINWEKKEYKKVRN